MEQIKKVISMLKEVASWMNEYSTIRNHWNLWAWVQWWLQLEWMNNIADAIKSLWHSIEKHATTLSDKDVEKQQLQYYKDTTVWLYAIDKDPSKVSKKWIEKNSFRLK